MHTHLNRTISFVASGKGGVGKTTYAVKLAEWYQSKGLSPVCINADAFNTGLALDSYPALSAERLVLVKNGEIVKTGFHQMLQSFANCDGPWVIDIGSNTFRQVISYIKELDLPALLAEMNLHIELHAIVAGGNLTADCVESVGLMAAELPWSFVIVLNEHEGVASVNGMPYLESSQFVTLASADRVSGIVRLKPLTDIQRHMLEGTKDLRLTANEVRGSDLMLGERVTHEQWAKQFFRGLDAMHRDKCKAVCVV